MSTQPPELLNAGILPLGGMFKTNQFLVRNSISRALKPGFGLWLWAFGPGFFLLPLTASSEQDKQCYMTDSGVRGHPILCMNFSVLSRKGFLGPHQPILQSFQ